MFWFGHRAECPSPKVPAYRGELWLVCAQCMRDHVPVCPLCSTPSVLVDEHDGFLLYASGYLCPACVARVRSAGPWQERRARAVETRAAALIAKHPTLAISERARRRTQLDGVIDGRRVRITLRIAARAYESARYVLRVELFTPRSAVTLAELQLPERMHALVPTPSLDIVMAQFRHLRLAFFHLGKVDMLDALDALLATAAALDARQEA